MCNSKYNDQTNALYEIKCECAKLFNLYLRNRMKYKCVEEMSR